MDYNIRSGDLWADNPLAVRTAEGGGMTLDGYAVRFGSPSVPLGAMQIPEPDSRATFLRTGAPRFREVIHTGAMTKALSESPDITLRYQHNMLALPLGRTTAGTLTLTADTEGLRAVAELPDNEWGRPVRDAVSRGDISGMSIRFGKVLEKWTNERFDDGWNGPVRHLHEIKLGGEISLVDFPAFRATTAAMRHLADELDADPDALLDAFRVLQEEDIKLTNPQRDLLMAAINLRTDEPFVGPKLAKARERLAALAS
jgi:HK97 family phage prohead protease